jgi:hypothetical protein
MPTIGPALEGRGGADSRAPGADCRIGLHDMMMIDVSDSTSRRGTRSIIGSRRTPDGAVDRIDAREMAGR